MLLSCDSNNNCFLGDVWCKVQIQSFSVCSAPVQIILCQNSSPMQTHCLLGIWMDPPLLFFTHAERIFFSLPFYACQSFLILSLCLWFAPEPSVAASINNQAAATCFLYDSLLYLHRHPGAVYFPDLAHHSNVSRWQLKYLHFNGLPLPIYNKHS